MSEAPGQLELEKTNVDIAWAYAVAGMGVAEAAEVFPAFHTSYKIAQNRASFGVFARRQMPVLEEGDILRIRNKIASIDWVQIDMGRVRLELPGMLTPTQNQIYVDKVIDFIAKGAPTVEQLPGPIMVSKNLHIIDGHHRWLGSLLMGKKIPTIEIDLPTRQLLKLALHLSNQEGHERNG